MKRVIEKEVFTPLIEQAGLNPKKARCRLNWEPLRSLRRRLLIY
ncbi:MAG: hypothetical protein NWF14_00045 [Candidatus Bathyarchaeota archaeon]|nr:hypothetical protein [Candidatus Bathyarchaeota archaeon]